ncbi:hypothetical protein HPB51_013311 [Rhipicephalus microplus]|uniref:B box-type domain-containing protein n=1 Tax=Rhipicephalus microplus TaxID=6941 RepID=A0A9J6DGV1_RHIMP|nr:hypothetical protein HPB51_013311 [Rhipicephalus microplus]
MEYALCGVHKRLREFYCTVDGEFICTFCVVVGEHKNHDAIPAAEQDFESIDENVRTCHEKAVEEMIAQVHDEDQPFSDECDDNTASAMVPPDRSAKEELSDAKILGRNHTSTATATSFDDDEAAHGVSAAPTPVTASQVMNSLDILRRFLGAHDDDVAMKLFTEWEQRILPLLV